MNTINKKHSNSMPSLNKDISNVKNIVKGKKFSNNNYDRFDNYNINGLHGMNRE